MTAPAAKVVAKKVATKAATGAAAKKYATTRPVNKPANTPVPRDKGGSLPAKKSAAKVITNTKKVSKKAYKGSFDSKFAPRQRPQKSVVTYRHVIAAEFWIGLIFILTRPDKSKIKENQLVQAAAFVLMMGVLFMVSGMGRNAAKLAAAFGGLVTLVLLMQDMSTGRFGAVTTVEKPLPAEPKNGGQAGPIQRHPVTS